MGWFRMLGCFPQQQRDHTDYYDHETNPDENWPPVRFALFGCRSWLDQSAHGGIVASVILCVLSGERLGVTAEDTEKKRPLFASDSQTIDANGRRSDRAAEFEVVANFRDVQKHVFQITRDRNLLDWKGQFTAGNPKPRRAARIISRNEICAMAEKFGDIQAFFDFADDLLRCFCAGLEEVISGPDPGRTGETT